MDMVDSDTGKWLISSLLHSSVHYKGLQYIVLFIAIDLYYIAIAKIFLFTLTKVDLIQFNECGCSSLSCIFWGIGGLHYSSRICPSSFLLKPPKTITIDLQVERLISLGGEVYNDKRTFCLCIAG